MCVSKHSKIIPEIILQEKSNQVKDYGLTLHNPDPDEIVGGMQVYQEYLEEEVACSTPEAIGFGLDGSRMLIAAGPPGTGKSLGIKVLGSRTGRPVIRLAATDLRKKYVGEGEARLKIAIDLAASMDGIIWIDEVEKLVQNTSAERDGGSTASVLSILPRQRFKKISRISCSRSPLTVLKCSHRSLLTVLALDSCLTTQLVMSSLRFLGFILLPSEGSTQQS